jgi:hypothetical protein
MLSLKKGIRIARIVGGSKDGEFVYIDKDNYDKPDQVSDNILDVLGNDFFNKYKLRPNELNELRKSLRTKREPLTEKLIPIYEDGIKYANSNLKKHIHLQDSKFQQMPRKDIIERLYISGPSGSGKSTFAANWIQEAKKLFKSDFYIFSGVDTDKPLDKLKPIRIQLDMDLISDPIQSNELYNSIVLMDDIDTIRQKDIRINLQDLRSDLLETGRHSKVRLLCTSHLLMNYKNTRQLLNEATSVIIFPKSGTTYHIKRFLKTHIGLDNHMINKLLNLPSRWISIFKNYPMYAISERDIIIF